MFVQFVFISFILQYYMSNRHIGSSIDELLRVLFFDDHNLQILTKV